MGTSRNSKKNNSFRWLFGQARSVRGWVVGSVALGFLGGLLVVIQAALIANIIQGVFIDGLPREMLTTLFIGLAAVIIARSLAAWGRQITGFEAGAGIRHNTRMALMDKICELGPSYTSTRQSGALTSTALEQVEGLQDFFAHYLPQLALAGMIPAAILCFVFPVSWAAGGLLLISAPLIPLFMVLVGMGAENISQRNFRALARLSAHFLDVLQGLTTLKLFGRSRQEAAAIASVSANYRRRTMQVLRVAFLSSAVLEFFSSMAIALVAVYLGMHYLGYLEFGDYGNPLDLADGFFILLLAPEFFLPLRELGTHYHARAQAAGASEEILKVLSLEPPLQFSGGGELTDPGSISIEFRGVGFSYDGERDPVLKSVDFKLQAGEHIALVGSSGSGKTTLINLMMKFVHPREGQILVNGQPLDDLAPARWRAHLAWLGQTPVLFHGSIRENILLGRAGATEEALQEAAEAARVADFCRELPAGLDTRVGERAIGLSRGQAQRVALARAFLKDAPLLLLDEPTAGLDAENERLVLEAIERLTVGRTVLTVTHRLENIARAARIMVISDGRISEEGTFEELVKGGRLFHRFAQTLGRGGKDA